MIIAIAVSGVQTCFAQSVLNSFVDLVLFGLLDSYLELMFLHLFCNVICVESDRAHSGYLHGDTMNGLLLRTSLCSNE